MLCDLILKKELYVYKSNATSEIIVKRANLSKYISLLLVLCTPSESRKAKSV